MDLLPNTPGTPGRRQNVTAKAWITRCGGSREFVSKVSLGKGRIYERLTHTQNRSKALDFNITHLLQLLKAPRKGDSPTELPVQMDLLH